MSISKLQKHGGHERVIDNSGNLYAPKDCELREDGRWFVLKVRGGELRDPRTDNWVGIPKQKYAAVELLVTADHTTSPVEINAAR